jgi:hypothetical protein
MANIIHKDGQGRFLSDPNTRAKEHDKHSQARQPAVAKPDRQRSETKASGQEKQLLDRASANDPLNPGQQILDDEAIDAGDGFDQEDEL